MADHRATYQAYQAYGGLPGLHVGLTRLALACYIVPGLQGFQGLRVPKKVKSPALYIVLHRCIEVLTRDSSNISGITITISAAYCKSRLVLGRTPQLTRSATYMGSLFSSERETEVTMTSESIFKHTINKIDGTPLDLSTLSGKKKAFLIVNMASY